MWPIVHSLPALDVRKQVSPRSLKWVWFQLTDYLPLGLGFPVSTRRTLNWTWDLTPKWPPGPGSGVDV